MERIKFAPNPEAKPDSFWQMEADISSEADLGKLQERLEKILDSDGAAQFVFVLKGFAGEDFVSLCHKASKELGKRLGERFGEEESFFDLVPGARYFEAQSLKPLNGYAGKHHSVGILEWTADEGEKHFLSVDAVFADLPQSKSKNAAFLVHTSGELKQALDKLDEKYGGSWEAAYVFDRQKAGFASLDE